MFNGNVLLAPKAMAEFIPTYRDHINHWRQAADENTDLAAVLPGKPSENGKPRLFTPFQAGLFALMTHLVAAEFKTPLAAKIAHWVKDAHEREPTVEHWAVIYTDQGNVSTLPYTEAGLATGYLSGSRLRFALVIDLKNYSDLVERAIADAPKVIGGEDGD